MLRAIREKTQGIIATFIVAMIAVPFALWGINSYFEGGGGDSVAEAGNVSVTQNAFRQALEAYRGQVKPDVYDSKEFKEMVLRGLLNEELMVASLYDAGYRTSDKTIAQEIRRVPAFQREGVFDPALYEAMLRRQGFTPLGFEQQLRRDETTSQWRTGLSLAGFATPAELDALLALQLQRRHFSHAVIVPAAVSGDIQIAPDAVERFYQENAATFMTTEEVRLEYVELTATALATDAKPTEEELRRLYEERGEFSQPTKRRVSHILIEVPAGASDEARKKARAQIDDVAKQIKGGAEFATLAKKHSQDRVSAKKGGDLGDMLPDMLPKALEAAVFALKPGEVTEPVQTEFGFHLGKLVSVSEPVRKPFKDVRAELEKMITKRRGEERYLEQLERLRNLAYEQAGSLAPAAKALGLPVKTTGWITRGGGAGIAADGRVVSMAFSPDVLEARHNSEVIELDANTAVVVRVAEHRPAKQRALPEVRAQIERILHAREAAARAQAAAEKLRSAIERGTPFAQAAAQASASFQPARTITREAREKIPPALVQAVFAAPSPRDGKAVHGQVALADGAYAVFALHQVEAGDPAKANAETRKRLASQLTARYGVDYLTAYQTRLQKDNPVTIRRDRL